MISTSAGKYVSHFFVEKCGEAELNDFWTPFSQPAFDQQNSSAQLLFNISQSIYCKCLQATFYTFIKPTTHNNTISLDIAQQQAIFLGFLGPLRRQTFLVPLGWPVRPMYGDIAAPAPEQYGQVALDVASLGQFDRYKKTNVVGVRRTKWNLFTSTNHDR